MRRFLLLFALAVAWFSLFLPWNGFLDPDAFYHAHLTSLIRYQGPLNQFPWLDLTSLHPNFVDQHFLFHIITIPFQVLLGVMIGSQVASIVLASTFVVVFYFCLKRLGLRYPFSWSLVLLIVPPLLFRLSLAKASSVVLIWFMLGLTAMALRKPFWGLLAGIGFGLTHGGWIILLGCQGLFLFGEWVFDRIVLVDQKADRGKLKALLGTIFGVIIALLLHPNRPHLLRFLWMQVVDVGVATPFQHVFLGSEWMPVSIRTFGAEIGLLLILVCVVFCGLLLSVRRSLDTRLARWSIAFAFPLAALSGLTLKSHRFIEYFIPLFVMWLATLFSLVDGHAFWKQQRRWLVGVGAAWIVVALFQMQVTWRDMHGHVRSFDQYRLAMQAISSRAQPGERVFHSNWDQFPQLFALNDRLTYIAGVDPTFFWKKNPELSDLYRDVTLGRRKDNLYHVIHDQFNSRFVLIELDGYAGHAAFDQAIRSDTRFASLYDDGTVRAYEINKTL